MRTGKLVELREVGVGELLESDDVRKALRSKAEAVAAAARAQGIMVGGVPGEDVLPIKVVEDEAGRARVLVVNAHPAALAVEAKHRLLASSLDAARDA